LRIPNLRELDWIVMKALEKDRSRRYDTASAFAADVQRYLADEPVQACPPSAWYRYRKFARRHRFGLATAGVVMLLVVSLGGGIGWLVRDRGAREREITLDQEAREAALDLEVNRLLDEAGPLMEQENWPEALAAVERAEKLLASAGRGARPRLLVELQNDLITAQRLQEIYQGPSKFLKANSLLVEAEGNNRRRPPQLVSGEQEFFWGREQDSRFAQAFHDIGIDIHALAPAEAAARIASRRAGIRQALVRALDEWAPLRRRARGDNDPVWQKLIAIARQADPDEWRNRFREASLKRDRNSLEGLAAIVPVRDVSPATLWLLASQLMELGARDQAMAVLEEAHHHYPHDFWINDALGWFYWSRFQPPRTDDALRFYTATLALRPNLPNTHHAVGDVLIAKGATDDAIKEFSRAIELAPEDARGWSARGTAYYRASRWEKALADYSKAIELDAAVAIVWNNRGAVHNELHHFDKAVADLNRAIELDRNCVVAWINRGCAYRIMRQHEKAISDCTKAIELDRQLALGWCSRASAFSEMGQWDHAIADLNKAIELDPKYVVAWTRRGFAYAQLRQHEKGLADCSKAIELDPTDAGAWSKRGEVYNTMGLWGKAIADLGKAVELDPRHVPSWTSRGVAHIQLQQYEQGLADLSKAIDLDPTYARAWTSRGAAYNELNQYEKGLADCSRAIALDPKFAMGWNNRGYTYFCLKRYENAQADFSKAIELDPKYANAWANRALSNIYLQQYKDALADYSQAHELEPGSCEYQNQLAWLLVTLPHAELRDPKRALELSGQTVKRNPNNAAFLTTLGAARFRTGDWTGAAAALHEAEGLAQPGHGFDLSAARAMFFQAMAQHQLGNAKEARQAYDRALEWSEANRNAWQPALVEELRRLQAEAAELLGVKKN
jgi:tetratricopeptide (TPR) repeat protein